MRRTLSALALAALMAFALPVVADHVQSENGKSVAFDHRTGNEWWVEVTLAGTDAATVSKVEAMDTGGPWTNLPKQSWGAYAASFHIEPGNQVRFRATWPDGATVTSCWFTHPAGVEQCTAPPSAWTVTPMGDGGAAAGTDLAVGDGDHDGRPDVYLANPQGLWQFTWTSNGWTKTPVNTFWPFTRVAIGDLTGDGKPELIGVHPAGFEGRDNLEWFQWDGQRWDFTSLGVSFPNATIGDILIGDIQPGGHAELYWGESRQGGTIAQVQLTDTGTWTTDYPAGVFYGTRELAAADVAGDGTQELYVGTADPAHGQVVRVDIAAGHTQTTSTPTAIVYDSGNTLLGLSAGDVDGDGKQDLAAALTPSGSTGVGTAVWLRTAPTGPYNTWTIALPNGAKPTDVAVGDADNAGGREIHVAGNDGHLYRMRWTGSTVVTDDLVAGVAPGAGLVVGDGDGDGFKEVYAAGRTTNGNPVQQVANHPAPPRPPPAWDESLIGDLGGRSADSDLAIGDGDRDGDAELYAVGRLGLMQFEWTGAAWQRTVLSTNGFARVAVGDGDRDGKPEVYASGANPNGGYQLVRFAFDGGAWSSSLVQASSVPVGTISIGDVDDDGAAELYVVMMPEYGADTGLMPAYQLAFTGGAWRARLIGSIEGGARSSWIGDGDRDGDRDLYVSGTGVHRLDITTAGAGSVARIDTPDPAADDWLLGIVAGDGDGDGLQEVYVATVRFNDTSNVIYRYAPRTGGWDRTIAASWPWGGDGEARDLVLADADNDGRSELWASAYDGGVWRIAKSGGAWTQAKLADIGSEFGEDLAVGDVDGDGLKEAYMSADDTSRYGTGNVYRLGNVPPPVRFDATFTAVRGNEWWIQANVAAAGGTLSKVDVRLNGGAWQPLTLQSWGGWAASYHAVQGTVVQLRATSTSRAMDLSACYQWIPPSGLDAAQVACASQPPPPPPGFDATFSGVSGNEWWVQASVAANQALAGVDARVNCGGTWHALTKQSWGGWAASFNIPNGSKVDFRARSTTGATDLSGGYLWTAATPTSAC